MSAIILLNLKEMNMIRYNGLSKAEVLMVLFNNAKPLIETGCKFDSKEMTLREAKSLIKVSSYFYMQYGRVLDLDLKGDKQFDETGYDMHQGPGAARAYLREYKEQKQADRSADVKL